MNAEEGTGASSPARILRDRAIALARVAPPAPADETRIEVLEFRLAHERYAVETRHVREAFPLRDLTLLPGTPAFLPGIVNLRGRIVPVLDIKKFFGLPEAGLTDLHRVIHVQGKDIEFGILADMVTLVRHIPLASLQAALPTLAGIRADYLKGVDADGLIVLDLGRLMSDPRIIVDADAPQGEAAI